MPLFAPTARAVCFLRCDPSTSQPGAAMMMMSVCLMSLIAQSGVSSERAGGLHFASIDRRSPHAESRLQRFTVEPVPDHAGRVKDFDRGNRRRCVAIFQYDDRDVQTAVVASGGCHFVRSAFRHRRLLTHVAHFPFYPWPFAFTFSSIGSHKPTRAPTESRMSAIRAMPETTKGWAITVPPRAVARRTASFTLLTRTYGVQCDGMPCSSKCVSQLIDRADVLIAQPQAGKTAAVGGLLVRGPAEQISVKSFRAVGVGRGEIDPTEASGIHFAELHHG